MLDFNESDVPGDQGGDAIAKRENVPSDHILLGVGSGEILLAAGRYFGAKKGEVIAAVPGYIQLIEAFKSASA